MAASIVNGYCDPAFRKVADVFEASFSKRLELGASVCITIEGETVVDLWGGFQDSARTIPWEKDTICVVFSCTKAATSLCANILLERGLLQLTERISAYWPQFANAGKQDITVEMILNHSAGIPAFRAPMEDGIHRDWGKMIARIENEKPFWKPGTLIGYHTMTFGWIIGELIRRVTGKTLGQFFHNEVAQPLGLDFHIGLPDEEEARVSPIKVFVPSNKNPDHKFVETIVGGKQSILYMSLLNSGVTNPNMREDHAAELGAHGAITNARSIAGLFKSLANVGNADIPQLLSRGRINAIMNNVVETDCDANLKIPTRYSQGFMVSMDNHAKVGQNGNSFRIGPDAFGHVGWGGSAGFADIQHHMAFGYAMNKVGSGRLINSRGQNLIDAAYACI